MSTQNKPTSGSAHLRDELPADYRGACQRAFECKVSNVWGRLSMNWVSRDKTSADNIRELKCSLPEDAGN